MAGKRKWLGYRGSKNLRDRGFYTWCGKRYISATKVVGTIDKPAIPRWAAIEVAKFVSEQLRRREAGEISGQQLALILADQRTLAGVPWEIKEAKADLGTANHDIAERWSFDGARPSAIHSTVRPYAEALLEWLERNRPLIQAAEFTGINKDHMYAGTSDWLWQVLGTPWLSEEPKDLVIDLKNSKDTWAEHALQLASYRRFTHIIIERANIPVDMEFEGAIQVEDGIEIPMPATDGGAILICQPRGCQLFEWPCGDAEFETFIALKRVREWLDDDVKPREVSIEPAFNFIGGVAEEVIAKRRLIDQLLRHDMSAEEWRAVGETLKLPSPRSRKNNHA